MAVRSIKLSASQVGDSGFHNVVGFPGNKDMVLLSGLNGSVIVTCVGEGRGGSGGAVSLLGRAHPSGAYSSSLFRGFFASSTTWHH